MKVFLCCLSFFLASSSFGQIADTDSSNKLVEKLVDLINKGDSKNFEASATNDFLTTIPKGALPGFVLQIHMMGELGKPELLLDLGEQRHYRIIVTPKGKPQKEILFVIGAESADKFFSIGAAPYKQPIADEMANTNPLKSDIDKSVQDAVGRYAGQHELVGISIGVLRNGHESFYEYGYANKEMSTPPNDRTIYEIGSITKTMTGILIARSVNDKKLSLDDDIRKYLPGEYPNLEYQGAPIRLRHLVTHTSGLPANPPGIPDDAGAEGYESYSHEKLLADLAKVQLKRTPGTQYSYSNMGGGLAGLILENVYKKSYEELAKEYIFRPAGMRNTGLALSKQMDARYATPYDSHVKVTDRWVVNGIESAGAVRSDVRDMLRYARWNLDGKDPAVALSQKPILEISNAPQSGIFWGLGDSRTGGTYLSHDGGTGGFSCNVMIMPREKLAVVILMNSGEQQPGQLAYEIALRILNASKK